ncbi:hypothetical protein Mapa_017433 [Marchantia paleacea]|nr:hypothetical protein Mapa_017433 [Marchantia paleacea]
MSIDPHKQIISQLSLEDEDITCVRIYRLPNYIKQRQHYIQQSDFEPQELFVGLYKHTTLDTENDVMHLDCSKLAIAREFCRGPVPNAPPTTGNGTIRTPKEQVWRDFVSSLDDALKKARGQYYRLNSDVTSIDRENGVVALDALFIVAFLRFSYSFRDTWGYEFQRVFRRCSFNAQRNPSSDLYDLLEWFVIKVYPFHHGTKLDEDHEPILQEHLKKYHKQSCDTFVNCYHLLDCAYLAICGAESSCTPPSSLRCLGKLVDLPCFKPSTVGAADSLPESSRNAFRIPSATTLRRMGITVTVNEESLTMNKIKFERRYLHRYVLLMPKLIMHDHTASVFKNLALYEQIQDDGFKFHRGDMRTYLFLMSSLLDSVQDVRLLINRRVIIDQIGSAETVCKQWNQMCDGLYIPSCPPEYWSKIQKRISELERSKPNRWVAEIRERNCSSFVLFISFVIVSLVVISTYLAAIFQVLAYAVV